MRIRSKDLYSLLQNIHVELLQHITTYHILELFVCLHHGFYICRTIDAEAQTHLQNLKTDVVNEANVHKFTIPWSPKGIDPQIQQHAKYLEEFCETFRSSIIDMID